MQTLDFPQEFLIFLAFPLTSVVFSLLVPVLFGVLFLGSSRVRFSCLFSLTQFTVGEYFRRFRLGHIHLAVTTAGHPGDHLI